ncbi:hypothetical protein KXD40_008305 [Peronospora effusa]|nr:hypothetical protein KXD40_008305 [Peronospora effusa]
MNTQWQRVAWAHARLGNLAHHMHIDGKETKLVVMSGWDVCSLYSANTDDDLSYHYVNFYTILVQKKTLQRGHNAAHLAVNTHSND